MVIYVDGKRKLSSSINLLIVTYASGTWRSLVKLEKSTII